MQAASWNVFVGRRVILATTLLCLAAGCWFPTSGRAEDWPKYRRDLSNTGLSAETFVSSANVSSLQLKWKFSPGGYVTASPAVATVNGRSMVFVGAWNGIFVALEAVTGAFKWSFQIDPVQNCNQDSCTRIASSAAVMNGMVYFGAANGYLYALNASTGALVWKVLMGDPNQGYEVWTSPLVYGGIVYAGVASHTDTPCVPGYLEAFNAATGAPVWTFQALDQSTCPTGAGTCTGAGVWASPALDAQFGSLYIGTSNPGSSCTPSTANATLYPDSVVALNPITGKVQSYYQATQNDQLDQDIGSSPVLHQTEQYNFALNKFSVNYWVTEASKDHYVYTLSRGLGGLIPSSVQSVNFGEEIIASPAVLPIIGTLGTSTIGWGNDIWVTGDVGTLGVVRQNINGSTSLLGTISTQASYSAPALINDLLFYGRNDGEFVAVLTKPTTQLTPGAIVYQFTTGGAVAGGPAISNGRIYFGSADGHLYCLSIGGN